MNNDSKNFELLQRSQGLHEAQTKKQKTELEKKYIKRQKKKIEAINRTFA